MVTLQSVEKLPTGQRGGNTAPIVKRQFYYCHTHGILRFGDALNKLNSGAS